MRCVCVCVCIYKHMYTAIIIIYYKNDYIFTSKSFSSRL